MTWEVLLPCLCSVRSHEDVGHGDGTQGIEMIAQVLCHWASFLALLWCASFCEFNVIDAFQKTCYLPACVSLIVTIEAMAVVETGSSRRVLLKETAYSQLFDYELFLVLVLDLGNLSVVDTGMYWVLSCYEFFRLLGIASDWCALVELGGQGWLGCHCNFCLMDMERKYTLYLSPSLSRVCSWRDCTPLATPQEGKKKNICVYLWYQHRGDLWHLLPARVHEEEQACHWHPGYSWRFSLLLLFVRSFFLSDTSCYVV